LIASADHTVAAVDYKKRFIDIEAGWPGSVGDARIWRCSALKRNCPEWLSELPISKLETGVLDDGEYVYEDIPPFILADSAYINAKHLVTTFKTTEVTADPVIRALNKKLGGARYHIENAFGILKARFQIFQRPLECSLEDVRLAIVLTCSTFVIHNFLIDVGDAFDISEDLQVVMRIMDEMGLDHEDNLDELVDEHETDEDMATRNVLLRHMKYIMDY